jgi:hypothetical protein
VNTIQNKNASALLSYFSLFGSVGTLLCCALPSLLVLAGLGATVAYTLSSLPWLVVLSRHKPWTFAISGTLIALSFFSVYYLGPRFRSQACLPGSPDACANSSRLSKVVLWISAALFVTGFFVAFLLGPILTRLDRQ